MEFLTCTHGQGKSWKFSKEYRRAWWGSPQMRKFGLAEAWGFTENAGIETIQSEQRTVWARAARGNGMHCRGGRGLLIRFRRRARDNG